MATGHGRRRPSPAESLRPGAASPAGLAPTASTSTRPPATLGSRAAKIDTLTAWWETYLHSEAEQAALRYTEALTRAADTDADQGFQRFHDRLAKHSSAWA
jgi:alkylhydroperoxidase family enzyme